MRHVCDCRLRFVRAVGTLSSSSLLLLFCILVCRANVFRSGANGTHTHASTSHPGSPETNMNMLQARYIQSGSPGNSFQPVHTRSCFSWLAFSVALGRAEATKACTWFGLGFGLR